MTLNVDGEPPTDEFTIASIPSGTTKSVSLFAKLRAEGFHSVTARIPEDRLPADDKRSIVVRAIKEVRVLLVDGEPGNEPRESETYFLKNALTPVPADAQPDYFVKATTLSVPEFSQAQLDNYDAVIMANVPDCSEAVLKAIGQYLRRGGGLMVFPGGRVNVPFYNDQLLSRYSFLPAALGVARGQADQDEKYFTLQDKDYQHSVVSIWNDPGSGTLGSAHFYRVFALTPAPSLKAGPGRPRAEQKQQEAGDPQVILKYSDGTPAVMERTWGMGRVVLFSSTADTAWNDLPVRLAFVPLIHRALGAIVQRQDEGLNVRVGEKFIRRVNPEVLDKDALFFKPRQTDALRDLRRIELVNGVPLLQYEQTDLAGVYDVNVADPPLALKFAAQPDASESSMEELSPAQINTLQSVANVLNWSPNFSLKGLVEKDRSGIEFWLPIVVLVLLLAALETFLGQWFSRAK